MEWKCCRVVKPFTASITDMNGHYVAISMNRGKKFDYLIDGEYLKLKSKGMLLKIPKSEFSMFKTMENETFPFKRELPTRKFLSPIEINNIREIDSCEKDDNTNEEHL